MLEFLSIKEMADKIRVHPNTIRNMIKSGRLNAFRLNGKKQAPYRIPVSEIQRLSLENLEQVISVMVDKKMNASMKQ